MSLKVPEKSYENTVHKESFIPQSAVIAIATSVVFSVQGESQLTITFP